MSVSVTSVGRSVVRRAILPPGRGRLPGSGRRYKSTSADASTPPKPDQINPPKVTEVAEVKGDSSGPVDIPNVFWYHRLGPVSHFVGWYDRTQKRRPYTVQLYSSLLVYLCGDLGAQNFGGEPYDPWRTVRHLIVGGVASAPGYRWFMWLGSRFNYPSKVLSIATKVVVQQLVFATVFNSYFFTMQALLAGQGLAGVRERFRTAIPESIINSAKFWPAVTAVNFAVISAPYRFLFAGGFAAAWQSYLSWLNNREARRCEAQPDLRLPPIDAEAAAQSTIQR